MDEISANGAINLPRKPRAGMLFERNEWLRAELIAAGVVRPGTPPPSILDDPTPLGAHNIPVLRIGEILRPGRRYFRLENEEFIRLPWLSNAAANPIDRWELPGKCA